jgi:hypothetical protein
MKMKQIFFAALLLMCPAMAVNAAELLDDAVVVEKSVDAVSVDDDDDDDFWKGKRVVIKSKSQKWDADLYVNFGFNTMLGAPSGYEFNMWPSFDFGFGIKGDWMPYGKMNVWSLGFGVDWRYYRMDNATYWGKDATTGAIGLTNYLPSQSDRRTSLTEFSLQVPVTYTHYFDKEQDWGVTLGAIVNFNTGAHVTREYTENDEDYEVETGSIHQRPVTIDGLLMVHTPGDFAIYCKYCPMKFLRDGYGQKMNQLSFGIYF